MPQAQAKSSGNIRRRSSSTKNPTATTAVVTAAAPAIVRPICVSAVAMTTLSGRIQKWLPHRSKVLQSPQRLWLSRRHLLRCRPRRRPALPLVGASISSIIIVSTKKTRVTKVAWISTAVGLRPSAATTVRGITKETQDCRRCAST
uniref:(northern house mosquito) hypothetical protein n=1 Tax=Culex pipiens TaxID=7175 RepID=A0A8D8KK81_CULPI